MILAFAYLAAYAAVMWWIRDGGRTPVLAICCDKSGRILMDTAVELGAWALELQLIARDLIAKRSLA